MQGSLIRFGTNSFGGTQWNPSVSSLYIVAPANNPFGSFNKINNPNDNFALRSTASTPYFASGTFAGKR